jgi:cellulose synthase (UDP-forming)
MPDARKPDDAPRWLSTQRIPRLDEITQIGNVQGGVLKDSYFDLSGTPHWVELPNLQLFSNAGYPFTRMADLSETMVVLPTRPTSGELAVYLELMGHFGALTGYPALNVGVTDAAGIREDGKKDILVVGGMDDQPALQMLNAALPVGVDGSKLQLHDTEDFFRQPVKAWWRVRSSDQVQLNELETAGALPDALVEGAEWPRGSRRSAVVVVLRDAVAAENFVTAFAEISQTSAISQSVSVLHGTSFSSYRIGDNVYRVGEIPLPARAEMLLAEFPWMIILPAAIFCYLMAMLLWVMVRRHARMRLQTGESIRTGQHIRS